MYTTCHTCVWVLESLWKAPLLQWPRHEDPCAREMPPDPQEQTGWRRPWSLGPWWGALRAGRAWQAQLCMSMRPRALPRVGLCLGGCRQGRLTPGGLRALAPVGLWALTGWESFTSITSNQYWGCGFVWSCQKMTLVASKQNLHLDHLLKPFHFPLPRCREI